VDHNDSPYNDLMESPSGEDSLRQDQNRLTILRRLNPRSKHPIDGSDGSLDEGEEEEESYSPRMLFRNLTHLRSSD
jgi:hypothetical protein